RDVPGGLALLAQVAAQVGDRVLIEAGLGESSLHPGVPARRDLTQEPSHRAPEFGGAPLIVAQPERQPARSAGGGRDQHTVVADLLDPPARRAECEHVADPGLVHHLLIQLADAGRLLAHHEHPEQASMRDGPARGHRQTLGARAPRDGLRVAVPHQARAQLREVRRRVFAGQHGEGGLVCPPRQPPERRGPTPGAGADPRSPRTRIRRPTCRGWPRVPTAATARTARSGGRSRTTPAPRPARAHTPPRSAAPARREGWRPPTSPRSAPRASARPSPPSAPGPRGVWGTLPPATPRPPGARHARPAAARTPQTAATRRGPPDPPHPCRSPAPGTRWRPPRAAART